MVYFFSATSHEVALTTNSGQDVLKLPDENCFSFSVCYCPTDYSKYVMLYPHEVVKGFTFDDYVKAGFNISVSDNVQIHH
ncbi:MAG: hypothetical protein ACRDE5_03010 [Ginsengibacter sp.]